MSQGRRCAVIQLHAEPNRDANIANAAGLVREAAAAGAELIVLPEKWTGYGDPALLPTWAESASDGPSVTAMRGWCKELGTTIVGGSITEALPAGGFSNTSLLITPGGETAAVYRKVHMFDVDVAGHRYRESERERAGDSAVVVRAPGLALGMSICYDLRFPELFRILALGGASVVSLPSAFTLATGRDHWDVLVRARAIENQLFVLAANQWGTYPNRTATSGRSVIVDPWGVVLARVADRDGWAVAELDLARVDRLRGEMPVLSNRRTDVYASEAARLGVRW